MPFSYPPIRTVIGVVDGRTRYQATCRTCGRDVCTAPQLAKVAVEEMRRAHGFEADCTRSHTLELASITHGTVDGYRAGCHGSRNSCGAAISCAEVYIRYQGDWGFRKRVNAGEAPAEIIAAEVADADAVRARDRAAARSAKKVDADAHRQREQRQQAKKTGKRPARPALTPSKGVLIRDDVARLHAEAWTDVAIAAELDVSANLVGQVRRDLGLPRVLKKAETAPSARALRAERVRELHAEGKTDREIAEVIGVSVPAANQIRRAAEPVRES